MTGNRGDAEVDALCPTPLAPARVRSGIPGLDGLLGGGLPEGRVLGLGGATGTGKTLLALRFLVEGIRAFDEPGILVTFDEAPASLLRNVGGFEPAVGEWIATARLAIVDCTPSLSEPVGTGGIEVPRLVARLGEAIRRVGARRVVIDGVDGAFPHFMDGGMVRREIRRLIRAVDDLHVTTVLTLDRRAEGSSPWRFGIEDQLTDGLVLLRRDPATGERSLEILKLRGFDHRAGAYPLYLGADGSARALAGVDPAARLTADEAPRPGRHLVPTGDPGLDAALGGGLPAPGLTLVAGGPGSGRTSLAAQVLGEGLRLGERCLWMPTHTPRATLETWLAERGLDSSGLTTLDAPGGQLTRTERLGRLLDSLAELRPQRVVLDSAADLIDGRDDAPSDRLCAIALEHLRRHDGLVLATRTPHGDVRADGAVARADVLVELGLHGDERLLWVRKHRFARHRVAPIPFVLRPGCVEVDASRRDDPGPTRRG